MAQKRDPILDIKPSTAREPLEYIFTLKFDTPREFEQESQWGTRTKYAYTVIYDGKDHVIFATAALHERIEETGAVAGDQVSVIRTGEGKDTRYDVARVVDGEPVVESRPRPQKSQAAPRGNPVPTRDEPDTSYETLRDNYLFIYNDLKTLVGDGLGGEDLRQMATSLFIECNRRGIVPSQDGGAEPERVPAEQAVRPEPRAKASKGPAPQAARGTKHARWLTDVLTEAGIAEEDQLAATRNMLGDLGLKSVLAITKEQATYILDTYVKPGADLAAFVSGDDEEDESLPF